MKSIYLPDKKLAVSALVWLIAAGGAWGCMAKTQNRIAATQHLTTALRVRKYVPAGQKVIPEMTEEVPVPEAYAPAGGLRRRGDLVDARGNARFKSRIGLRKGEWLAASLLME